MIVTKRMAEAPDEYKLQRLRLFLGRLPDDQKVQFLTFIPSQDLLSMYEDPNWRVRKMLNKVYLTRVAELIGGDKLAQVRSIVPPNQVSESYNRTLFLCALMATQPEKMFQWRFADKNTGTVRFIMNKIDNDHIQIVQESFQEVVSSDEEGDEFSSFKSFDILAHQRGDPVENFKILLESTGIEITDTHQDDYRGQLTRITYTIRVSNVDHTALISILMYILYTTRHELRGGVAALGYEEQRILSCIGCRAKVAKMKCACHGTRYCSQICASKDH